MSSVYTILEEEQEDYTNEYGFTCGCCGKPVRMEYTDRNGDGYNLICEDENCDYGFVSASGLS